MKVKILLLSERDFLTLPVMRSLNRDNFRIFVMGPKNSATRFSRFHSRYFQYPKWENNNKDEVLVKKINQISAKYKIDILIPLDLESTLWIAKNKNFLKLPVSPTSDYEKILQLHSKWDLTAILEKISIAYPKTILVKNGKELLAGNFSYPFLIKPLDQDSGKGIVKVSSDNDIKKYNANLSIYKSFPLILQEYIDGYDVDMSLLAVDGVILAWTIQRWNKIGVLELIANEKIYKIGEKIIAQERYSGFMHIDLRIDNRTQEIFVLECNPRAWGTMNASILAGVDFVQICVDFVRQKQSNSKKNIAGKSYTLFGKTFIMLMTRPWLIFKMSKISRRDFTAVITDPIPYLLLAWKVWRGN